MSKHVCPFCGEVTWTTYSPNDCEGSFFSSQQLENFFARAYNEGLGATEIEAWFLDNGKRGNYCSKCRNVEIGYEKKDGKIIWYTRSGEIVEKET